MQTDHFIEMTSEQFLAMTEGEKAKPAKYRNHKFTLDGVTYDSEGEYHRWLALLDDQAQGYITSLSRQVRFEVAPRVFDPTRGRTGRWKPAAFYIADFVYCEGETWVIEDFKNKHTETPVFRLKWHLMLLKYPEYRFRITRTA